MIAELIRRIEELQSKGDQYFERGLFPCYRKNSIWSYSRPDHNIFTSLSVALVLKSVIHKLKEEQIQRVEGVINGVLQNVNSYQNKTGRPTYNFYPTDADHFPNGLLMHRFKHFKLPDDADDTALVYLLKEADKDEIERLRVLLASHAAADGVYDTWFGVNMPSERDVCALCNVMLLVCSSGLEFNQNDLATLSYLNRVIVENLYRENTFWVSRHYATVPLIVYHYARLLSFVNLPQLREAKETLQSIIPSLIKKEENKMNRILLSSSALRLNVEINEEKTMRTKGQEFYSFIGAPFAPLPDRLSKKIADKRWAWIGWKCEAHEVALELENMVLKQ